MCIQYYTTDPVTLRICCELMVYSCGLLRITSLAEIQTHNHMTIYPPVMDTCVPGLRMSIDPTVHCAMAISINPVC